MDKVGIGLLGYGTVGSGVGQAAQEERRRHHAGDRQGGRAQARAREGLRLQPSGPRPRRCVTTRVRGHRRATPRSTSWWSSSAASGAALDFQLRALKAGKNVVTANKQLLAQHGAELFAAAEDERRAPALRGERRGRRARHQGAARVAGRGRGQRPSSASSTARPTTCSAAMAETGADYADVLKKAQQLGYAEADPTEDVGGKDAAAKMAILSSIAFHSRIGLDDVDLRGHHQGHRPSTSPTAAGSGWCAKLLGVAKLIDGRMNVRVYPGLHPRRRTRWPASPAPTTPCSSTATRSTRSCCSAPGAGSVPTASAVIGDVISVVNTVQGRLRAELHLLQGRPASSPTPTWSRGSTCRLRVTRPARRAGAKVERAVRRPRRQHPLHGPGGRRRRGRARAAAAPGPRGAVLRRARARSRRCPTCTASRPSSAWKATAVEAEAPRTAERRRA